jgi:tagaturonate reductase
LDQLNARLVKDKNLFPDFNFEQLPEKVIQFGEGNFLRGFVDWMIHEMNRQGVFNGRVVAIQPTPHGKVVPKLNEQDGLYTLILRGLVNGEMVETTQIITSISRGINPYEKWNEVLKVAENQDIEFVFSNTTENGLVYKKEDYITGKAPSSFPGKLTAFLYHRFISQKSGMVIIPCELVENNGTLLKQIVLKIIDDWEFPNSFKKWIEQENIFCNTLVDRIITGFPSVEIEQINASLGYYDKLLTVGEPYHLFAIESHQDLSEKIPFQKVGLNVQWGNVAPIRELKTRILNGAHTMIFAIGLLAGKATVYEAMQDESIRHFILKAVESDILPYVNFIKNNKEDFAKKTFDRFLNPYIKHYLIDIGQNSLSKFKSRLLPTLKESYESEVNSFSKFVTFSLSALLLLYRPLKVEGDYFIGKWKEKQYRIRDRPFYIQFLEEVWKSGTNLEDIIRRILSEQSMWSIDLTRFEGLEDLTREYMLLIEKEGIDRALKLFLKALS